MITRAVIMARGLGTRMRRDEGGASLSEEQARVAASGAKGMIPVGEGGRPFLDYVLSALADAGLTDACLVIGPEHDRIRKYYTSDVKLERMRVHFAIQQEPRGTADAVAAAEAFGKDRHFLLLNSDNYYPVAAYRALAEGDTAALPGFERETLTRESNIDPGRIKKYALLRVASDGTLEDIVEKPDEATYAAMGAQALVSMNLWAMPPAIFDACRRVQPSPRGELELADAVRIAIREYGMRFRVLPFAAGVLDLSSRGDVEAVVAALQEVDVRL